jgi:ABC-2 type transport system ATP-binding protein
VRDLRASGVTIILTTHYLEEAEDMADRIGVINKGRLLLVRPTADLMGEFGRKQLTIELDAPLQHLPEDWAAAGLSLSDGGRVLTYDYDTRAERTGIGRLLADLNARGLGVRDVATKQTSLEEVFISLVSDRAEVTADVEPSGVDRQEAIIAAEGRA